MPLKIVFSKDYLGIDVGEHPWQADKYRRVYERALEEGLVRAEDILWAGEAPDEDLKLVHTEDFVDKIRRHDFSPEEILRMELPFSASMARLFRASAEASILGAREALKNGGAYHAGGGFHHAFPSYGSGFCLVHDAAIAVRKMQRENRIRRAIFVDLDVHQGDGTAKIFENDESVFTFSMHQENNFPYLKQKSDLDIGLEDDTADDVYLSALKGHLPRILDAHKPELLVYIAGADSYREDLLGGLKLSLEGLAERDRFVLGEASKRRIPFLITLAGGYARRPADTVRIHLQTLLAAAALTAAS